MKHFGEDIDFSLESWAADHATFASGKHPATESEDHALKRFHPFAVTRREFLTVLAATLAAPAQRTGAQAGVGSLKDAFKDLFLAGTALDFRTANELRRRNWTSSGRSSTPSLRRTR